MKDILQDIVSHTHALGFLNIVKITGSDEDTKIDSMSDDRTVILMATTSAPVLEFQGVFGMPQLNKLKFLLDCAEYKENAKIALTNRTLNGQTVPDGIHFENASGDFKNDYKFMNTAFINEKLKSFTFKEPTWSVSGLSPTVQSVQRFAYQAAANPEHLTFLAKNDNGSLKFSFGDTTSDHGGEFTFASNVSGKLDKGYTWPVAPVLSILKIADVNNTKMSFSNDVGSIMLELDSGIATYKYIIPAQR
jgi:hypothetical protein